MPVDPFLRLVHVSDMQGAFFSGCSLALDIVKTNWAIHFNTTTASTPDDELERVA